MTVQEALQKSGFTSEQISALDPKLITIFSGIQTEADQAAAKAEADRKAAEASVAASKAALDQAELEKRSVKEFWDQTVNPSIADWDAKLKAAETKAANADALAAFYKAQNEGARSGGFVPMEAPKFASPVPDPNAPPVGQVRDPQGRFVPGPSGSPVFDTNTVISKVGDGMNTIQNIMWKYQSLYAGQPLPIPPSELIAKADQLKLSPMDYASRTFRFAEKEEEQRQAAAKAHDDAIRTARDAEKDAEWKAKLDEREKEFAAKEKKFAETHSNHPEQRVVVSSRIPELQRKVESKDLPDPLMMNEQQRHANTTKMIRESMAEKSAA